MSVNTNAIQSRNRQYSKVLSEIYKAKGLRGKIVRRALAARFLSYDVRLSNPLQLDKALKIAKNLALLSGSTTVVAGRRGGVVRYDFQLPTYNWSEVTREDVSGLELGLAAGRVPVSYSIEDYHSLFAGATKSGKSTALKSLVAGMATHFRPGDIDLYIVDPHRDYAEFSNLAFLAAPIAHDREAIAQTIKKVASIYEERKASGDRGKRKVWLLIDEAQDDICLGSKESGHTAEVGLVASLARGAGKFGIRLIIGSQKPTEADLPGILSSLTGRYVGRVTKGAHSSHLTGVSGLNAQLLSGRGDFLSVTGGDATRFQVAYAPPRLIQSLPTVAKVPDLLLVTYTDDTPIVLHDRAAGRPVTEVKPDKLAYYMTRYVSINDARNELDIGRTLHNRYKSFSEELKSEMKRIGNGSE